MTEHDHAHAGTLSTPVTRNDDLAPGRASKSSSLDAPAHPIVSGLIARKAERDGNGVADGADQAIASAASSSGMSLPTPIMRKFESSLGTDLSSVRVHTGAESQSAASAVGAKAYTMGQDIHFGAGQFNPSSGAGEHLLAHEVAHTVQQRGGTPTRQNKLEVSTPQDAAEHEADHAADAMVSGGPATISGFSGVQRQVFRDPNPLGPNDGLSLFAPNTSRSGFAYEVPTKDYRANVVPAAPAVNAAMPASSFTDPGPIPGWKTTIPGKTSNLGPFSYQEPARDVVISGEDHSNTVKDAWESYKNELMHNVADTWDSGARAKMDSYAQQTKGDPELDAIVKDMHDGYRMSNVGQKGTGTLSDQAAATNIHDGQTASAIGGQVAAKGTGMNADLAATAQGGQNGTVAGPVGKIVDDIKAERKLTMGAGVSLQGTQGSIESAALTLQSAIATVEIDDLKEKVEDQAKKKEELESGKAALKKYAPEIAGMVNLVKDNSAKIATITGMVKAGPEAMEGDPAAILEIGKSVLEIAKWDALAKFDSNIASLTDQINTKFKLKNEQALEAAKLQVSSLAKTARGQALELQGHLLKEKTLHATLADAVQANWKGKDKQDGKLAAQALRALPIVRVVIATLNQIKTSIPKLPDAGTRASQGYRLATEGVGAPGAAQLLKVAGWIAGSPQAIDVEIAKWTAINAQLQAVTAGLGL
jgi:hypothetical protein